MTDAERRKQTAERQKRLRERRAAEAVKPLTVWARNTQRAELKALADLLAADDRLTVVSVTIQDAKTGRMRGVRLGRSVINTHAFK
jgi:hypothetical protein